MTFTKKFTRHILVVDDEPLIRKLHTELLVELGFHVDSTEDGSLAWLMLQLKDYDLLIIDNLMPNLSGIGLLKKIYAAGMALPVIFATGTVPTWEFVTQPWLRPAVVFAKPYAMEELLAAVNKVLIADHTARYKDISGRNKTASSWQIASRSPAFCTELLNFSPV